MENGIDISMNIQPNSQPNQSTNLHSRRAFLGTAGIASAAYLLGSGPKRTSAAEPPVIEFTNPGAYRFTIGEIEALSISDGWGGAPDPTSMMMPEDQRPAMKEALKNAYQPADTFPFNFNVLVLRTGNEIILFDGGNGAGGMGHSGLLEYRLAEAGLLADNVTAVFLSHAHPDHIGGLVHDGKPFYPNAKVVISNKEHEFWTGKNPDLSGMGVPEEMKTGMTKGAQSALEVLAGQLEMIEPGKQMFGCVTPQEAYGHTPGHLTYLIESGDDKLYHIVDLAHNPVLMFADPNWAIAFDTNRKQAIASRKRIFAELAAQRTRVYGYHLPFPALGHIARNGDSFAWVPENWQWLKA